MTSGSDSAIASTRSRRSRPAPARLDVDDDVAAGQRPLDRLLDQVGRPVALDHGLPGGHADDDVGEVAPGRLAQPQAAQLDVPAERGDRPLGGRAGLVGRAVHQHVGVDGDQPRGGHQDDRGDDQRRHRVALRAGPLWRRAGPTSTATEPSPSAAKCNAFERSAGLP